MSAVAHSVRQEMAEVSEHQPVSCEAKMYMNYCFFKESE